MKQLLFIAVLLLISCAKDKITPSTPQQPTAQIPNEIYVAGFINVPITGGFRQTAAYWKNDELHELPGGSMNSFTSSIMVAGNDIYVAGTIQDTVINIFPCTRPVYWKNDKMYSLPLPDSVGIESKFITYTNSVLADGTDIYICGVLYVYSDLIKGDISSALVWKNGELQSLNQFTDPLTQYALKMGTFTWLVTMGIGEMESLNQ